MQSKMDTQMQTLQKLYPKILKMSVLSKIFSNSTYTVFFSAVENLSRKNRCQCSSLHSKATLPY